MLDFLGHDSLFFTLVRMVGRTMAPLVTLAGSCSTWSDVNDYRLNKYIDKYNKDTSNINVNLYKQIKETGFPLIGSVLTGCSSHAHLPACT
jgi:hypothetical protein